MNDAPESLSTPPVDTAAPSGLPIHGQPADNPYPWIKPMPMMWICVIICIVLIVVGSMMNRAQAESRKKPAIDSFSKVLDDFDFTDSQRATILEETRYPLPSSYHYG